MLNELSVKAPSITFSKKANLIRVSDEKLGKKLTDLSPTFKTSPTLHQTVEDYLASPQPTLCFLYKCNKQTKIWAIRFGFTADGSISLPINGKSQLAIACYNPSLSQEWKKLLESFGLSCKIHANRASWCGIAGVRIQNYPSIKKFYDLGGFIDGVKISRKSKWYCGMAKNELLERIVNMGKGRLELPTTRSLIALSVECATTAPLSPSQLY